MKRGKNEMREDLSGLGRIVSTDARDREYLLPRPKRMPSATQRYWTLSGPILDQGSTSQCVVYATDKWLTTFPISNPGFGDAAGRTNVYHTLQTIDEWPGEDYDGTSVRAAFKYLKARGLCSEYRWAFDLETVVAHVLTKGPMVMGTDWHMDMFMPDIRTGYIWPQGEIVGGHAWMVRGVNRLKLNPDGTKGAVRMVNSWGEGWGQRGKAWLTFTALDQLIQAQGEAAVAIEVKSVSV